MRVKEAAERMQPPPVHLEPYLDLGQEEIARLVLCLLIEEKLRQRLAEFRQYAAAASVRCGGNPGIRVVAALATIRRPPGPASDVLSTTADLGTILRGTARCRARTPASASPGGAGLRSRF